MKQVSPAYIIAYKNRDEAMDKYNAARDNLQECKDFQNADAMRDARLAVFVAAQHALPEYEELLRTAALLQVAYDNGLWDKDTETP